MESASDMKDILKAMGGMAWLIARLLLIFALGVTGLFCLGSVFFYKFVWEGLIRLAIGAGCALAVFGIIRAGRDKETEYREGDPEP